MTENKSDKQQAPQDYKAMIQQRVANRAVSLKQSLYESTTNPPNRTLMTDKKFLSETVQKSDTSSEEKK